MSEKLVRDSDYTIANGVLRIHDGVEEIPNGNFRRYTPGMSEVTVVIIPPSVKRVGDEAFAFCDNLAGVIFDLVSQSLCREIGAAAFIGCYRLRAITLPYKLKVIGNGAFANTGLFFIEIPETVEKVSFSAFRNAKLHGIIMNEGVKYIENFAFLVHPTLLQTIVIPSTVLSIEGNAIVYDWIPDNYLENYYDGVYYRDKESLEAAKAMPKKQVITRNQKITNATEYDAFIKGGIGEYDPKEPHVTEEDLESGFVIIN